MLWLVITPTVVRAGVPVCALLTPAETPRVAVPEAQLLGLPEVDWVERARVDDVLTEQSIQMAVTPGGVDERVKLGRVLKADLLVLVLVRPVKGAKNPAIEVVVSETAGGLRLFTHAVPVIADAAVDVAGLVDAVKMGIARYDDEITAIVAVPPIVSRDLGYEFEHLKGAYAKLAESVVLGRPGMVVVEIAEANALAKEIGLAAPGTPPFRGRSFVS